MCCPKSNPNDVFVLCTTPLSGAAIPGKGKVGGDVTLDDDVIERFSRKIRLAPSR